MLGHVADLVGFLTWDPLLMWNTVWGQFLMPGLTIFRIAFFITKFKLKKFYLPVENNCLPAEKGSEVPLS